VTRAYRQGGVLLFGIPHIDASGTIILQPLPIVTMLPLSAYPDLCKSRQDATAPWRAANGKFASSISSLHRMRVRPKAAGHVHDQARAEPLPCGDEAIDMGNGPMSRFAIREC